MAPADRLTSSECADLGSLAAALDCPRVRLYRANSTGISGLIRRIVLQLSRNRAVALGNHVMLPKGCQNDLAVLAHELTHCAQYQRWGPFRYFGTGMITQIRALLHRQLRMGASPYYYRLDPGKPFEAYGMEQQAQIVEDCFRGHPGAVAISPFRPGRTFDQVIPSA